MCAFFNISAHQSTDNPLISRPHHTTLNQLILRRLPSALPPCTSTPQTYARGIAHFLPIFSAFEIPLRSLHALASPHSSGIHRLYLPALERGPSLEHDIRYLLQRLHVRSPESSSLRGHNAEDVESQSGPILSGTPRLNEFVAHISVAVTSKPHVLLTYTWIFYMALFQGGRYIRSKLRGVDEKGFWGRELNVEVAGEAVTGLVPLSFWEFPAATRDGEDLKTEFKARFQDIEQSLSPAQHQDILQEAVEVMMQLLEVVREIDTTIQEENPAQNEESLGPSTIFSNKETQDVDKASNTEEVAFLPKLLRLSLNAATEMLILLRSFVPFAPSDPPTVPVTVTDSFSE